MVLEGKLEKEELKPRTVCIEIPEGAYQILDKMAKEGGITVEEHIVLTLWAFSELMQTKECRKKLQTIIKHHLTSL